MKGPAEYKWRLSELTAARGLQNTTDRIPLQSERGIMLSQPRVYLRLVNQSQQGRAAGHRCDLQPKG
ncbi:MAG TPA: hypothetical protein VIM40_01825 [Arthrobacter sp.]